MDEIDVMIKNNQDNGEKDDEKKSIQGLVCSPQKFGKIYSNEPGILDFKNRNRTKKQLNFSKRHSNPNTNTKSSSIQKINQLPIKNIRSNHKNSNNSKRVKTDLSEFIFNENEL